MRAGVWNQLYATDFLVYIHRMYTYYALSTCMYPIIFLPKYNTRLKQKPNQFNFRMSKVCYFISTFENFTCNRIPEIKKAKRILCTGYRYIGIYLCLCVCECHRKSGVHQGTPITAHLNISGRMVLTWGWGLMENIYNIWVIPGKCVLYRS